MTVKSLSRHNWGLPMVSMVARQLESASDQASDSMVCSIRQLQNQIAFKSLGDSKQTSNTPERFTGLIFVQILWGSDWRVKSQYRLKKFVNYKQNNLLNDLVILNKQQILPKRLNKPFLRDPMKFLDCRTFCVRLHIDAAFAPRRQFVLQVLIRVIVYLHGWFVLRDWLPVSRDPYFNWLRMPITEPELGGLHRPTIHLRRSCAWNDPPQLQKGKPQKSLLVDGKSKIFKVIGSIWWHFYFFHIHN